MTPGNNGASTPEDDDPFGYLYADGQANGAQPPSGGYGYPNSVNRVRPVGTRQYGQHAPAGAPVPQQQGAYGRPNTHYAAPETFPGGAPTAQHPSPGVGAGGGGGRGRGPNTKGLLIGAIAVVAAVVIGIGIAMSTSEGDDDKADGGATTAPTAQQSAKPSETASKGAEDEVELPAIDAKALRLDGGAATASDVEGAESDGGIYVTNLNQPGSTVTWTVNGIPEDGLYTLFTRYSTADDDQAMTLTVNGKPFGSKLNMSNFAGAKDGDFAKGWTQTFAWPTLSKGTNTISLSCQDGDKCNVLLDQMWLKAGKVKK
ncbi:carbohydrate-binding protein [Streptomyces sp. DH24]|uniref:carbohydrate-binding protein n=1 Tax=Streptomyces sp. DH24 TaxID=3040123 RepID=UPI00244227D7|nr:carbohydrate-binding protein [Streptomyces sp. DH24]MDG9718642.1 carbohydrate-binding protein [Streptomyces sp. DH24]